MELDQGDIVICTVEKISGTTVFAKIQGEEKMGSIILPEIAPGRIRNLRDYVVPKKTIICKILKILNDHIELSLRRVTPKEQKEAREQFKLEKNYTSVLKTILKEKTNEIVEKIKEKNSLYEFLENSKEDSKELEKLVGKEDTKKILEILQKQKKKSVFLKKEISLTTTKPNGIAIIKKIFSKKEGIEIKYIKAGKYSIKTEEENIKKADTNINTTFSEIEKEAKSNGLEISLK